MNRFATAATVIALSMLVLSGCSLKNADAANPVESDVPAAQTEEPAPATPEPAPAPALGTLANPAPAGSAIDSEEFDGTTYSSTFALTVANANQYLADANMFNDAAPAGMHYAVVAVTIINTTADTTKAVRPGSAAYDLALVDSTSGLTYPSTTAVLPNGISGQAEIYSGQSATGEVAFLVPDTMAQVLIGSGGVFVAL